MKNIKNNSIVNFKNLYVPCVFRLAVSSTLKKCPVWSLRRDWCLLNCCFCGCWLKSLVTYDYDFLNLYIHTYINTCTLKWCQSNYILFFCKTILDLTLFICPPESRICLFAPESVTLEEFSKANINVTSR